jgi:hypothetical protein
VEPAYLSFCHGMNIRIFGFFVGLVLQLFPDTFHSCLVSMVCLDSFVSPFCKYICIFGEGRQGVVVFDFLYRKY